MVSGSAGTSAATEASVIYSFLRALRSPMIYIAGNDHPIHLYSTVGCCCLLANVMTTVEDKSGNNKKMLGIGAYIHERARTRGRSH